MTEFEKKILLTKGEYKYLLQISRNNNLLTKRSLIKQINYYYDTSDLSMNQKNITCRIRLKDGKYKGTIKQHSNNSEQSNETNIEIKNGLLENAFIDMGLELQGELRTERNIIWKDSTCEIALDKNDYLGYTDYELEIEYTEGNEKRAQYIFTIIVDLLSHQKYLQNKNDDCVPKFNIPSKSTRFFERRAKYEVDS